MKKCPHCDDTPVMKKVDTKYTVKCMFCEFQTILFDSEWEASSKWDEVCNFIDMQATIVAIQLIDMSEQDRNKFLLAASYNMVGDYMNACYDTKASWQEFKQKLFIQIKVAELAYDKFRKKIESVRADEF